MWSPARCRRRLYFRLSIKHAAANNPVPVLGSIFGLETLDINFPKRLMDSTFDFFSFRLLRDMHRRAHRTKDHRHIYIHFRLFVSSVFCVFQINCTQSHFHSRTRHARTYAFRFVNHLHTTNSRQKQRIASKATANISNWFTRTASRNDDLWTYFFHFRIANKISNCIFNFTISRILFHSRACCNDH